MMRVYQFGSFRLYPDTRVLFHDADMVPLSPKAVHTLVTLVRQAGQVVEKDALIREIWRDTIVEENNLAHHISVLRKTLRSSNGGTAYIETVPKRGYRFVGKVHTHVDGSAVVPEPAGTTPVQPVIRPRTQYRLVAAVVVFMAAGVFFASRTVGGRPGPSLQSLAVLPFRNVSGDPQQNYLADGMTDTLIGELSKIRTLRVISRTSVMSYREGRKPLREVSSELNTGAVIEGSVARFGDQVRVSIQLHDGAHERLLWGGKYVRDFSEIPKLWTEVASAIAREIHVWTEPGQALPTEHAVKREAFEAYLRGRYYWNKRTPENIRKALDFFTKAIDEEPAYARAYAGLADCYNQLGTVLIGGERPTVIRPMAIAAARQALEIDPDLPEAHAALAYAKLYDWQWAAAEQGLKRAIQLDPSYASAYLWYAHYLSMWKRHDEALRQVRLAQQLDPLSPIIQTQVGWILQHAGRYDEAIQQLRTVLDRNPDYLWALWRIGSSYASRSMFPEGIDALEKAATVSQRSPSILGTLAETYGLAGRRSEARKLLNELEALSRRQYVPAISFAQAYIGLGDSERVLQSLERAYENREQGIAWLAIWRQPGAFRSDPRFHRLLMRVGLPDK